MPEKIRILYVDDESTLLDIGKQFLEQSGDFTVTTATSAPDAIRLLEQEGFDAVVSDYQMPGMDGIQFLVLVRTKFGQIPFILFTGRGREEVVIQAINSGADFYLQKGGNPEAQFAELSHKIKQAVERKSAEVALKRSEENYRHLIEHSDEAIVVAQDGMLRLVNHRTVELTGYSDQELLSMSFYAFIHSDDRAMVMERYQKRMKGEASPSRYSFRLSPKDESTRWVEISVAAIDWDGRPATLNFLTDITERKQADDSLRKEQQFSKLMLDSLPGIFYLYTYPENRLIRWNKQHETLLGYTAEEIKGKLSTDLHLPEYKDAVLKAIDEVMEKGQSSVESTLLAKDGRQIPFFFTGVRFEAPGQLYFMGIGIDLTERKRQEVMLQRSEEKFRVIADYTVNWESWFGPDGKYIWVSPSVAQFTGYSDGEILAMPDFISTVIVEEDRPMFTERFREAIGGASGENFEFRYLHRNRTKHWLNVSWQPIVDRNGNSIGTRASGHDITERKQVEEALREGKELLTEMTTQVPGAVYQFYVRTNGELGFYYVSERSEQILGLKPDLEGYFERFTALVIPEHREGFIKSIETSVKELSEWKYEGILQKPTGEKIWFFGSSTPSLRENEIIFNGIVQDITDRKRAEEALVESEEKYRTVFENTGTAMVILEEGNIISLANEEFAQLTGFSKDDIEGKKSWTEFVVKEDRERMLAQHRLRRQNREKALTHYEFRAVTKSGDIRNIYLTIDVIPGTKKSVASLLDITARKQAEYALTESFAIFKTVMDSLDALVYVADMKTYEILFINQYGRKIWGDLTGKICWESIQGDQKGPCQFCTNEKLLDLDNNPTGILIWEFQNTINGQWYECHDSAIRWTDGRIVRIEIASDITERKRAEEALHKANKQLNLLSDITRHDIINQIFALKGYLELSHDVIDKPENLREFIKKEQQAANTIEQQIQFTKDYQKLGAAAPAWQNVNASIQKAVAGLPMRAIHVEPDPADPEVYADALFDKVFYNLIDNALCYGGDQMKTIRVSSQESDTSLTIVCEDDGVGISAEDKKKLFWKGFGKHTGLGLFLSREILAITGITITENGEPGKGARFEIHVPAGMWRKKGMNQ